MALVPDPTPTRGKQALNQNPPADWYIDPQDTTQLRYWNGTAWTEHRSPRVQAPTGTKATASNSGPPTKAPEDSTSNEATASARPEPKESEPEMLPTRKAESKAAPSSPQPFWLNIAQHWPSLDVVGEAYRDDEVIAVIGRRPKVDEEIELRELATLIPEPDNPYDKNAISVRIKGHLVGYMSKDDAKHYKPYVDRIVASGHVPVTSASIWAVLRDGYNGKPRFFSNVRLALSEPHLLLPVNDPPSTAYSIIPWGNGLQVTGEEQHFDILKPFVGKHDRELLLVTLHRGVEAKPRGDREFAEVRVNGKRVGEMSTATSKHFFPIIDHLEAKGLTTAAWAQLKGSSLTAEVVLQATKATDINDDWLNGEPVRLPELVPVAGTYYVPPAYSAPKRGPSQKAKAPKASPPPISVSAAPAKSGCAVIVLAAVAASAVAIPVISHLI